jgi:hypothetical protein
VLAAEALEKVNPEHVDVARREPRLEEEALLGAVGDLQDLLRLLDVLREVGIVNFVPAGEPRHPRRLFARQAVEEDVRSGEDAFELGAGPRGGQVKGVHLARPVRALADPRRRRLGPFGARIPDEEIDLEVSQLPQQKTGGTAHSAGAGDYDLVLFAHG